MSKYRKIKVEFKDTDALRAALEDTCAAREIEFEEHPQGAPLVGYAGKQRAETARFIIRREHVGNAANDLGFAEHDGAYQMIISDFDAGRRDDLVNSIKQRYAYHAVCKQAELQGYQVHEQAQADGSIKLRLARAY